MIIDSARPFSSIVEMQDSVRVKIRDRFGHGITAVFIQSISINLHPSFHHQSVWQISVSNTAMWDLATGVKSASLFAHVIFACLFVIFTVSYTQFHAAVVKRASVIQWCIRLRIVTSFTHPPVPSLKEMLQWPWTIQKHPI